MAAGTPFSSYERLGKAAAAQRLAFHLMSWDSSLRETGGCVCFSDQCSLIPEALIWAYVICDNIQALFSIILVCISGVKWVFRNVLQNCSELEKQGSISWLKILCIYFDWLPKSSWFISTFRHQQAFKNAAFSSQAFPFTKGHVKRWSDLSQ